jgi:hypothetical protein
VYHNIKPEFTSESVQRIEFDITDLYSVIITYQYLLMNWSILKLFAIIELKILYYFIYCLKINIFKYTCKF